MGLHEGHLTVSYLITLQWMTGNDYNNNGNLMLPSLSMKFTCIVYSHLNWGTTNWINYQPKFIISNEFEEPVLKMLYLHVVLVLNICGECQQVGRISKQWSGLVKEYFTDDYADIPDVTQGCKLSLLFGSSAVLLYHDGGSGNYSAT
ncbi:uncharacterized protein [Dysidea avara]|uniref:uncharacterized protein isoform X2 n=1 Tax=Dysidea avara TaxID=196820 RepID=UPI00332A7AA8